MVYIILNDAMRNQLKSEIEIEHPKSEIKINPKSKIRLPKSIIPIFARIQK